MCYSAKETHQLAQANDEKNRKLREAFGIGEYDKKKIAEQKAEEAREIERRKIELANKKYMFVGNVSFLSIFSLFFQ